MRAADSSPLDRVLRRLRLARLTVVEQHNRQQRQKWNTQKEALDRERQELRAVLASTRAELAAARDEQHRLGAAARASRDRVKALVTETRAVRARWKEEHEGALVAREEVRRLRATLGAPREDMLSLLPVRAAAAPSRHAPDAVALEAGHAARSVDYEEARHAWRSGDRPAGSRQVTSAGMSFTIPADVGEEASLSHRLSLGWLPIDDIIRIRPFAVGGVMLDIGGNIGTTCIPRVVFGDFSRACAAEPDAVNYRCLVGNIIDNGLSGRILPQRVAIASRNGSARLRRSRQIGGHQLLADGASSAEFDEVPCLTVDAWLEQMDVPVESVSFVKVDTQGWDPHAIAGAPRLLARKEVVWQIEVSPSMMLAAGYSVADLAALVAAHFTHVKEMDPTDGRGLRPATELPEMLAALQGRRRFTNVILLNAS
jgi:FkbM family methyltransferase